MNAPWPFPAMEKTIAPQADAILGGAAHTPEELETAIQAQGKLVEALHSRGRMPAARQAFESVRLLSQLRTPETIERLERERGLAA